MLKVEIRRSMPNILSCDMYRWAAKMSCIMTRLVVGACLFAITYAMYESLDHLGRFSVDNLVDIDGLPVIAAIITVSEVVFRNPNHIADF